MSVLWSLVRRRNLIKLVFDGRFDVGEMLSCGAVKVDRHTKTGELYETLSLLGSRHILNVIADLPNYYTNALPQPTLGVSHGEF